jgi:hypothetical protein
LDILISAKRNWAVGSAHYFVPIQRDPNAVLFVQFTVRCSVCQFKRMISVIYRSQVSNTLMPIFFHAKLLNHDQIKNFIFHTKSCYTSNHGTKRTKISSRRVGMLETINHAFAANAISPSA